MNRKKDTAYGINRPESKTTRAAILQNDQDTLLSYEDLAVLLPTSPATVKRDIWNPRTGQ